MAPYLAVGPAHVLRRRGWPAERPPADGSPRGLWHADASGVGPAPPQADGGWRLGKAANSVAHHATMGTSIACHRGSPISLPCGESCQGLLELPGRRLTFHSRAISGRGWYLVSNQIFSVFAGISGLVVEYIIAIDVTRVRFPADAKSFR